VSEVAPASEPWPFPAGPDAPVLTQRGVAFLGRPVLLVLHDPEGDWQMLGEGSASDRAHVIGLGAVVRRDLSLRALADLPRGWIARRRGPDAPWERLAPGDAPATPSPPDAGQPVAPVHTSEGGT
jgi:hypothetical protein